MTINAFVVLLLMLLNGCVTSSDTKSADVDGRVVERSKPQAPAWTTLAAGRMHESDVTLSYVGLSTKLRDLPLGLKSTQLQAFDASRNALVAIVKDKLESDRGRLTVAGQGELDRQIVDVSSDIHARYAKVVDIYFETLVSGREELPEYYNAFVLVTMPRDRMTELYESLGQRLRGSSDSNVRDLGQSLQTRAKGGGLSH